MSLMQKLFNQRGETIITSVNLLWSYNQMLGRNTHWKGSSNICHQRIQLCAVRTHTAFWENSTSKEDRDCQCTQDTYTSHPVSNTLTGRGGVSLLAALFISELRDLESLCDFQITALQGGVALGPFSSPCRWGQLDPVAQQMSPSRIIQAGVLNSLSRLRSALARWLCPWGFLFL